MLLMKFLLVLILMATLTIGAVFGLMTMSHSVGHMANCFASLAQGVFCPQFAGLLDFLAFHFNALSSLSSAIFESLSFTIAGFIILLLAKYFYIFPPAGSPVRQAQEFNAKNFSQCRSRLTRWLSLLEKRDPCVIC